MLRRDLLTRAPVAAAALVTPMLSIAGHAHAEPTKILRFVPYVDLGILDPVVNTAALTRTHGYLVFDTLYGIASDYSVQPQMVEGHVADDDFRLWTLTLREGLTFHTGEPVLARDVVASLRRWGAADQNGRTLLDATEELTAPSDRVVRFRMKRRFALLPDLLGKIAPSMACIMPERLAATEPTRPVKELVGSGPFRFKADELVHGARVVYEKFAGYVPRPGGAPGLTAGPKIVNVDRVEWITIPDAATAAAALQSGEVDWLDVPSPDLLAMLARDRDIEIAVKDTSGVIPVLRFNTLLPPFDKPAIRAAVLGAVSQRDFMSALSSDPSRWRDRVGAFCPGTPLANDAAVERIGALSVEQARQAIRAAGYGGERVVLMAPSDHPVSGPVAQVAADLFRRLGLAVDVQDMDSGTLFQRRTNRGPLDKGGWNCFPSAVGGTDLLSPAVSFLGRGNGRDAWYGWPAIPRLETLRDAWFAAATPAEALSICRDIQATIMDEAPYVPLGQLLQPAAIRRNLTGVLDGFAKFWSVRKA